MQSSSKIEQEKGNSISQGVVSSLKMPKSSDFIPEGKLEKLEKGEQISKKFEDSKIMADPNG
jgi:hypothetical protein